MKLRFRDIVSETEDETLPEAMERRAPPLPKRKHSDYSAAESLWLGKKRLDQAARPETSSGQAIT